VKVTIAVVACGSWYPRGVARLVNECHRLGIDATIQAWVNCLPPHTPTIIAQGYDYTPYAAKPFALRAAIDTGADVAILCDASFYPIRDITPMVEHIQTHGAYLCRNGYPAGRWASDRCLQAFNLTRDAAMQIEEVSSYCVGLRGDRATIVDRWCSVTNQATIAGAHTNDRHGNFRSRNRGWVSNDERCRGHRHDQTALSLMLSLDVSGGLELSNRPYLTAYKGHENDETVLVCEGMV
jgi:hypothetical protein